MDAERYRDLQNRMQELDDASLLRIILLSRDDYSPETLSIAGDEITKRGLAHKTLKDLVQESPEEFYLHVAKFCPSCIEQTTNEPATLFNLIVIRMVFLGSGSECDVCGSIIQRRWFFFGYLPVFPFGKYRVKYIAGGYLMGPYISRRLKPS